MAIKNKTLINDGSKRKTEEEETRRIVNSSAPVSRQKTVKTKNNTQSQAPNPAGVLPAASQRSFATPPQYDRKFLEYSVANSKAEPKEQTRSGLEYEAAHQQWLIDEAKKEALNNAAQRRAARANEPGVSIGTTANQQGQAWAAKNGLTSQPTIADRAGQSLSRAGNRLGQVLLAGASGLPVTTANQQGQAWAAKNGLTSQPTIADRARENLKNSETGRLNTYIDQHQAAMDARRDALNVFDAKNLSARAMSIPDFTAYSKYDPNRGNDKDFDEIYEQVNQSKRWEKFARTDYNYNQSDGNRERNYLTAEEKSVFNYLYNSGDRDSAVRYLEAITPELEKRRYEADVSRYEQLGREHPVLASAGAIAYSPVAGVGAVAQGIESAINGRVNPYSDLASFNDLPGSIKTGAKERITEDLSGINPTLGQTAGFLYDAGMSSLESASRALSNVLVPGSGAVGLVSMALSVAQTATNDYIRRGYSQEDAAMLGFINGLAEYVTENMGMERLTGMIKNGGAKGFKGFLLTMLKNGIPEAGEEAVSSIVDNIAELMVEFDKSEWKQRVNEYQAAGMDEASAEKQSTLDMWSQVGLDALAGFVSGGMAAGIGYAGGRIINASVNAAANSQTAKAAEEVKAKAEQIKGEVKAASSMTAEEWEASRKDQSDAAKKRRAAVRESGASLGVSEDMIRSVEAASDVTGQSVTFRSLDYDSLSDDQKKNILREDFGKISLNGYRNDTTGEIVLNSNAKTEEGIKFILGHELGHSIEGGKLWTQLRDLAYEYYARNGKDWNKEARDLLAELEFVGAKNFDQDSEMTANFAGKFLLDNVESIEWLVNSNHSMATRVWNWINEKLATRFADDETATKAVLTRARELYGRALAANAAKAGEENARTLPTAQAQTQTVPAPAQAQNQTVPAQAQAQAQTQVAPAPVQTPAAQAQTQNQTPAAEGLQPPAASVPAQASAARAQSPAQNAPAQAQRAAGQTQAPAPTSAEADDYDESDDEVAKMNSLMRGADLVDEEGNAKYSVTEEEAEKREKEVRDYVDSLPEKAKFSVNAPVEKVKTEDGKELIAVHNVNLKDFLETMTRYGGFPAWSLAVMKQGTKHENFGPISVLFKKSAVDPQADSRNKLYAGDAWTGTFRDLTRDEIDNDDAETLAQKIGNIPPRRLDVPTFSSLDEAKASGLLMNEKDEAELKGKISKLYDLAAKASDRPDNYMAAATRIFTDGMLDAIDDETLKAECRAAHERMTVSQQEYTEAKRELDSAEEEWDRRDGDTWEDLGYPGEDDEILNYMFGLKRRIANLREKVGELYQFVGEFEDDPFAFDPETMSDDALRDSISAYLIDKVHDVLRGAALDMIEGSDAEKAYRDNMADSSEFTKKLLNEYKDVGISIVSAYNDIRNNIEPTVNKVRESRRQFAERYDNAKKYFEAKPARVLGFEEVAGVALPNPDNSNDQKITNGIIKVLDENGINHEFYSTDKYDPSGLNAPDNRVDVINRLADSVEGAKFSVTAEEESNLQYSIVDNEDTLNFLNNQDYVTVYRAMQLVDGKLYPPMAAKTKGADGKWAMVEPMELGRWYQSDEGLLPRDSKGKVTLNKGNGSSIAGVAYNPYWHTSKSMLNDQFSSAWRRPELVVVEGKIPVSELTSGYRAEGAKDTVGETEWHSGPVATQLKGTDNARKVYLSRWFQGSRIVPDSEVAASIAETLKDTGISIPKNVVTPAVLAELEKLNVPISQGDKGNGTKFSVTAESVTDSDGNRLSESQNEYFKNSKVRDEDGNLLKVYHGSPNRFTIFDPERINTHGAAEGRGFYFTDNRNMAEGYTHNTDNVYEGYLNITKPLDLEKRTLTAAQVKKLLRALDPTGDDIISNYSDGAGYPSKAWYNRALNDATREIINDCDNDADILAEIANSGGGDGEVLSAVRNTLGYDGYIAEDKYEGAKVYVAFESNQFKNADNLNPSDNPDIRYSVTSAEDEAYLSAARSGDIATAQRMVDEAARKAGYTRRIYHGTGNGNDIHVFKFGRAGIYTTDDKDIARTYGSSVYDLYGKEGTKVLNVDAGEYGHFGIPADRIPLDFSEYPLLRGKDRYSTDDISRIAFVEGYDVVIIKNVYDDESAFSPNATHKTGTDIVYKDPNQIKSAEPIVRDDNGEIIPLTERFNPEEDDIRWSVTSGTDQTSLDNSSESEYNTLASDPRVVWGSAGQTRTSGMEPVPFRYAVVPADTLIVSNDEYGNLNPDYPAELQPRDRSRATSQADIQRMANGIIPDVLADSPYVNNGAPVIRGDGVVVGGNGRAAALRLAESIGRKGAYDEYIRNNAARFGIEGELPENPVLVRVAYTDDWQGLARKSNESTNAAMSSTEQAESDAARLDSDILSLLDVGDDGDLNTAANRDFISEFVNNVAGESERGSLVDSDGYLSQEGLRRVQAAVFAKAYGDTGLLSRMSESLDDDMRNVTTALMGAASRAAVVKNAIAEGAAYDINVTDEILAGIEIFEEAKKQKTDIDDIAGQMSLEGRKYGDAARAVALFVNTNKRSGAKIRDFISAIYDEVLSLGDPGQISMDFGGGTDSSNVTVNEVFRRAAGRLLEESGYDLTGRENIDLGFEIEDIGESESLPRNTRQSQSEPVSRNAGDSERDEKVDTGRREGAARAPERGRSGRVVLPEPGDGRYIDRESTDFADVIRQEAAKLGMIEPAAGSQEARGKKAGESESGQVKYTDTDRAIQNAYKHGVEAGRNENNAYNMGFAAGREETIQRYGIETEKPSQPKPLTDEEVYNYQQRYNNGQPLSPMPASAQDDYKTRLDQTLNPDMTEVEKLERERRETGRSERENALTRAQAAAQIRHTNADITVPSFTDTEGQQKMFDTQYKAARDFNKAMDRHKLSKTDMALVRDLMAGVKTPEFDYGEAENPGGVQNVFETLIEADRANRTIEAYKDAIHEDLNNTARSKLENVDVFRDKSAGILYARETQERNIRDIAPAADAEAIIAEYFDPVHEHTSEAKKLSDEYTRRVRALKIDTKRRSGNKDSENVAIQFIGEIESIIEELEEKTQRFNKRVESQSRKSQRTGGADVLTQEGLGTDPYAKQPKKYGMSLDEYRDALANFKKNNPNLDYNEIHRKIDEMQKIYGELYDRLNEVYMRWGYPPMGKIKNYFPHFLAHEDGILSKIGGVLGFDQSAVGLPAYLAGLTKDFRPGRQWFANALARLTNYTEYDTLRGFDRYIEKAADIIYHTEDIQKLRSYANTIRYLSTDEALEEKIKSIRSNKTLSEDEKQISIGALYSNAAMTKYNMANYVQNIDEYVNTELANKRSDADRWWERNFGRSFIYGAIKSYQRLRARSAVQGNITSALTNIIPVAQVSGVAGIGTTAGAYIKTLGNMVRTMFGGHDTLREGSVFLTNRQDYESVIPKNILNRLGDLASLPFAIMDRLGSETVWRALYDYNRNHGMSHETASALADKRAADIVADRSKGALPTLFMAHNPLINIFTRFMVEQNNTVSYLKKDVPRYFEGWKHGRVLRTGLAYAIIAMMSWLFNEGFEALFGRRPAQDLLGIINDLTGDISGYKMPNVFRKGNELLAEGRLPTAEDFETRQNTVGGTIKNTAGNLIDQAPFSGAVGTLLELAGVDLDLQGGRFEVSDIGPDVKKLASVIQSDAPDENLRQVLAEELSKPVTGLLPAGNQIQKTVKGAATMIAGGSYKINEKGEKLLQYPAEWSIGDLVRSAVAGKSALPTAQDWVKNGFDTLNAKDTALYDSMTGVYGVKPQEALELIKGLNGVTKTDDASKPELQRRMLIESEVNEDVKIPVYLSKNLATDAEEAVINNLGPENANKLLKTFDKLRKGGKTYQKIDILRSSGLSRDTKESIYTKMIAKEEGEKIDAALKSGLSFDDYLDVAYKYKSINQEDIPDGAKATEFAKWVDEQRWTDEQKSVIKESNKYWQSIPVKASNYEKLTGAGLSTDQAYDLYERLDALEPLTGAKNVSHGQKWDVIIDSGLSTAEQLDVIKAVSYDGEYYDFKISSDYGVEPKAYKAFLDSMPKYDADGNGSYKQAEIKAALDAATGLTTKQKAVIWQLNGSSTTAKNNPYSTEVGKSVLNQIKEMKEQTEREKAAASAASAPLAPPTATGSGTTVSSGGGQKIAYTPKLGVPRG